MAKPLQSARTRTEKKQIYSLMGKLESWEKVNKRGDIEASAYFACICCCQDFHTLFFPSSFSFATTDGDTIQWPQQDFHKTSSARSSLLSKKADHQVCVLILFSLRAHLVAFCLTLRPDSPRLFNTVFPRIPRISSFGEFPFLNYLHSEPSRRLFKQSVTLNSTVC